MSEQKVFVVKKKADIDVAKDMILFQDPKLMRAVLNPFAWKIVTSICNEPKYPAQISREMGLYRQKVHYHIKQLERAGLVKVVKTKDVQGGIAKFYSPSYPAVGIELPYGDELVPPRANIEEPLRSFLRPFIVNGEFDGKIVVGSPEPHGPNKTVARDGHYGLHLGFFLGRFFNTPKDFVVKLDTDVKTEKEEKGNLITIGGPGTNLVSADINSRIPIHFDEKNYWTGLRDSSGNIFSSDWNGVIAKIPNPYNSSKSIIILAGVRHVGTKAAVLGITNFWRDVLKDFHGEELWAVAIRGFDLDGDGKVDSVEVASSSHV